MKDRLFPPIPGLLPSPFHIRLQFKERPNRGKGQNLGHGSCQGLPLPEGRPKKRAGSTTHQGTGKCSQVQCQCNFDLRRWQLGSLDNLGEEKRALLLQARRVDVLSAWLLMSSMTISVRTLEYG